MRAGGDKDLICDGENDIIETDQPGGESMKYTLMQKNHIVAELDIAKGGSEITGIGEICSAERLPVGTKLTDKESICDTLDHWWRRRSIPISRSGLSRALRILDVNTPQELLTKCFGLSLSDQYWVKPEGSVLSWEDINFFDNEFSEDVGEILFGNRPGSDSLDMRSPDCTADGYQKKKWKITDGKRCLIKGGANFFQEPFNEVIASMIADRLGLDHVEYTIAYEGTKHTPVSVCGDFITRDTELVTAGAIAKVLPYRDGENKYEHFLRCCEKLCIPDVQCSLDEMIVLDYIIANQDRHMGNFGAIRNADTLDYNGMAPIFDCGTSLRYDTPAVYIEPALNVESQPFAGFHNEQIKLVKHPERFDLGRLEGIEKDITELMSTPMAGAYIDEERMNRIIEVVLARIGMLREQFRIMNE